MKIRHPILIRSIAFLMSWFIRAWLATIRYKAAYSRGVPSIIDPRRQRLICAVWHESLLAALLVKVKAQILISQHADGELIAQVCEFLGHVTARGSTTRGGGKALEEMAGLVQSRHLLVTPDGPRGPRRGFQAGAIYLASRTGLPMVMIGIGFSKAWRANSWDRFAVPLPFSTVYGVVSEPVAIPANLSKASRNAYRAQVESLFVRLTETAEAWAAGGPRPVAIAPTNPVSLPSRAA